MTNTNEICWNCNKNPIVPDLDLGLCEPCNTEREHREYVLAELPKAQAAVETLHRLANTAAGREALKEVLGQEHRTNQQLVCRALVAMLEKWADDAKRGPGWYDLRNQATVEFATAVFANVPESKRYFPYI